MLASEINNMPNELEQKQQKQTQQNLYHVPIDLNRFPNYKTNIY